MPRCPRNHKPKEKSYVLMWIAESEHRKGVRQIRRGTNLIGFYLIGHCLLSKTACMILPEYLLRRPLLSRIGWSGEGRRKNRIPLHFLVVYVSKSCSSKTSVYLPSWGRKQGCVVDMWGSACRWPAGVHAVFSDCRSCWVKDKRPKSLEAHYLWLMGTYSFNTSYNLMLS